MSKKSNPEAQYPRIYKAFLFAVGFSSMRGKARCQVGCAQIAKDRKLPGVLGRRAFMHVGHHPAGAICVAPEAEKLSDEHLLGLFLHELGHIATQGNDMAADAWVFTALGVPIEYKGKLTLEWVNLKKT